MARRKPSRGRARPGTVVTLAGDFAGGYYVDGYDEHIHDIDGGCLRSPATVPAEKPPQVFTSTINVIDVPVIHVPVSVLPLCDAIQGQKRGLEFSILLKGEWRKEGFIVSDEGYVIPTQAVTAASVDYDHEEVAKLAAEGYNCVLHSHPIGAVNFSSSDESTINVNFDASILYCNGNLSDARVCLSPASGLKLRLAAEIRIRHGDVKVKDLDKIVPKTYTIPPAAKRSTDYRKSWYRWG